MKTDELCIFYIKKKYLRILEMKNTIVKARAPLRLGLAGGGTDVSPYCETHGGYVLNATISRYAYAVIKIHDDSFIKFEAADLCLSEFSAPSPNIPLNGYLDLHKATYNYMIRNYNDNVPIMMELITFCDSPIGSGLGSSSTVVVVMIRAFAELLNLPLDDYKIAHIAFQIEREDCRLQGGRQDQFSATFGGFNFMEFYNNNRSVINPLRIKNWIICELEASLLLFYTGVSRESAKIIAAQSENITTGHSDSVEAMHSVKGEALLMKEHLLKGDFSGIVDSMQVGWESKKRTANGVSNSLIESIYVSAMQAGALAGKVSGAGGGGFMLFFVPIEKRTSVIQSLSKFEGQISNCHFTKYGAQAWKI